jgi:hypothetical protein
VALGIRVPNGASAESAVQLPTWKDILWFPFCHSLSALNAFYFCS